MEVARPPLTPSTPALGLPSLPRRTTAAALLVLAAAAAAATAAGVAGGELGRFALYQLGWVLLPGFTVHRLLDPGARGLERLVVGWALGYCVSIGAFHATAALDARKAFLLVPLLSVGLLRRPAAEGRAALAVPALRVAAVAASGVAFLMLLVAPLTPLPGTTSAAYPPDVLFHLAAAAEALHHFPVTDPHVAGTPLPYHLFANYDMAAAAQATGVPLDVTVLRLAFVPLLVLTVLGIGSLAALAGARGAGVALAPALFLFANEIDLETWSLYPFWGGSFFGAAFSPSFLLSAAVFAALLVVARNIVVAGRGGGAWMAFVLLTWTLGGAKGGSLAVVVGGALLYAVDRFVRARVVDVRALACAAIAAVLAAVQLIVLYDGARSGLELRGLGAVRSSFAVEAMGEALATVGPLGSLVALALGTVAVAGAPAAAALAAPRGDATRVLLLCVACAAAVPLLAVSHRGESQLYWLQLGLLAAAALGGVALERGLGSQTRPLLAAGALWGLALLVLAYATEGDDYLLRYGGAGALGAAIVLAFAHRNAARRACVVVLVVAAALNVPLDTISPLIHRAGDLAAGTDVTPDLHAGLVWVREHTAEDAVLAVARYDTTHGRADNFAVSALAERRVYLEGWRYSVLTLRGDRRNLTAWKPFGDRRALNDAAFAGDRRALRALSRAGVDYLVVDRRMHRPAGLGRVVFENPAVAVVAIS